MNFEITEWHKNNPNDWCAVHPTTHKLIDRDDDPKKLIDRLDAQGLDKHSYVLCRNWGRPESVT